jgi:hypothetical protein
MDMQLTSVQEKSRPACNFARQIVAMKIHGRFIRDAREYSLVLLECSTGRFPIAIRILLPVENSLDL